MRMKRGEDMTDADKRFDDFLRGAYSVGVPEPTYEADAAAPEEVGSELRQRIIDSATRASGELLARRLLGAAGESGWTRKDLVHETLGHESEAEALLDGRGDPRAVTVAGLGRLLWRVGLDPAGWRELLTQTVAGFIVFRRTTEGQVFGRTTNLAGERRGEALSAGELMRDAARARREAESFVEEVEDEWTSLASGKTTDDWDSE
jgi:hypothetical protein